MICEDSRPPVADTRHMPRADVSLFISLSFIIYLSVVIELKRHGWWLKNM